MLFSTFVRFVLGWISLFCASVVPLVASYAYWEGPSWLAAGVKSDLGDEVFPLPLIISSIGVCVCFIVIGIWILPEPDDVENVA